MFICLHKDSKERINSTSRHWVNRSSALKHFDRENTLICQNCGEPLTYRRGEILRPHFAHRRASDCPFQGSDSNEEETTAKVELFQFLENLIDTEVQMDVLLEGETRTIDLLIFRNGNPSMAFWLLSKDRRSASELSSLAHKHDLSYEFIYTKSKSQLNNNQLELSKMQRDYIAVFPPLDPAALGFHGHITCIDIDANMRGTLLIYRGLKQHCTKVHDYKTIREINLNVEANNTPELAIHESGNLITSDEIERAKAQEILLRELAIEQQQKQDQQIKLAAIHAQQEEIQIQKDAIARKEYQDLLHSIKRRPCIYCKEKTIFWSIGKKGRRCVCNNCEPLHKKNEPSRQEEETQQKLAPPSLTESATLTYTCRECGVKSSNPSSFRQSDLTFICPECLKLEPEQNKNIRGCTS